tara:strand:- start:10609 stop:11124 length:516 start_codon:yes stop_codon:yes gene_type:complete
MSEEIKNGSDDQRVNITAKEAAASLVPPGVDVSKLTPEQQMEMTSNMVQASTLHEKYIADMSPEEVEVFDALLIATPQDVAVKERFESAYNKFNAIRKPKEEIKEEEKQPEASPKVSPKGEMDVSGQTSADTNNGNLLSPENDAPLGDDLEYFKFLEKRYRQSNTIKRQNQ